MVGRADMAFAWFGGQWIAMLLRRIGERGIALIGRRQRCNASREARMSDIV
jgi:hypothetical protein